MKNQNIVRSNKTISLRTRYAVLTATALMSIAVAPAMGATRNAAAVTLEIPAQPLSDALNAFAQQSGLQILFHAEAGQELTAPALTGMFTPVAALQRLLENTALEYEFVDERTVAIRPIDSKERVSGAASTDGEASSGSRFANNDVLKHLLFAQSDSSSSSSGYSANEGSAEEKSVRDMSKEPEGLEEIIVSAQKRIQRAQDVPTSLTALSADRLQDQGASQLSDYVKQIPGLRLVGATGPGQGKPVIRGVSAGVDRISLVGIYLDDVPFSPSSLIPGTAGMAFDPDLADIDRIEVLKGPQSTLYGASALGGLIKYVTKRPDLSGFDSRVRVEGTAVEGAQSGYGVRGSMNIPIAEELVGLRVSGFYRDSPGYIDNLAGGDNVNSSRVKGARFSLLTRFNENIENTFSGFLQDIHTVGRFTVAADPVTYRPTVGRFAYSSVFPEIDDFKYRSLSNTTAITLPFATLTNIASYSKFAFEALDEITFGLSGYSRNNTTSNRYSDELRLASLPGRFEWLAGAYYTREKDRQLFIFRGTNPDGSPLPSTDPLFNLYTFPASDSFVEKAVFGNVTYHFTDQVEATIGARYSANDQDYGVTTSGLFGANTYGFPTEDSATNYLGTLTYKPNDDLTLYVRAASAYRPGGPNVLTDEQRALDIPESFSSDSLWNYEAGVKGSLWESRISYSLAAYHMDWTDIQIQVITGGFVNIINTGEATVDGLEASLSFIPVEGLDIGLNAAYNDAKLGEDLARINAVKGDPLPYSPEVALSALADYRFKVAEGVTMSAGFTYAHSSKFNTGYRSNGGALVLPSYGVLDVRTGIDWSRYSLVLRADNVTNKYAVSDASFGTPFQVTPIRPRTYALSLEVRL